MHKRLLPAYLLTFVNVLGFSILMPVLPFIVESYGADKWVYGLLLTLYAGFQFLGAPFLGSLSDSLGRKPILVISQAGTLLSWFIFLIALNLPDISIFGISLALIIIGASRALDGITGGNISVSNAYVSDITTREEKSYIFGYLGGIAGLGLIIGPGIGGVTASTSIGFTGTLIAAAAISVFTLIAIIVWLKESHPKENRTPRKKESILNSFLILRRIKEIDPKPIIKLLFLTKFFFGIMMALYMSTIALFIIDLFEFSATELGLFMLVVGLFLAFNQAFLSRIVIRKIGEFRTLLIGLALSAIGLICITLTANFWLYIAFYYIMNLGLSLSFPTFNALISIHADPKKQGAVMGVSESINSFALAAFLILGSTLYDHLEYKVYYIIAALPMIAFLIAYFGFKRLKNTTNDLP
ncbi:MAG: DHA1 family tetracycline resistance protein-like MFS transporter [Crocinitomix sp.]|jgi:DHA1 family tetracycline resistance protein-like MFS transporter